MIPNLKLKWNALREKTIHDSAPILVGFMWSLSVLKWLLSLWIDWVSSRPCFLKKMKISLKVYHPICMTRLSCKCRKKREKKHKNKNKNKNKIKTYSLYTNLPPQQQRQKHDTIKSLISFSKYRSVKVIN